ncbi:hypothetical protein GCM10010409_50540 [Mycolicibacterium diernhoferi]
MHLITLVSHECIGSGREARARFVHRRERISGYRSGTPPTFSSVGLWPNGRRCQPVDQAELLVNRRTNRSQDRRKPSVIALFLGALSIVSMASSTLPPWLTTAQVAEYTGVHSTEVYHRLLQKLDIRRIGVRGGAAP